MSEYNKGHLAIIRRCKALDDIIACPEFYKINNNSTNELSSRKKAMFLYVISKIKTGTEDFERFIVGDDLSEVRLKKMLNSKNDMELVRNIIRAARISNGVTEDSILNFIKYFPNYDNKKSKTRMIARIYEKRFTKKGDVK